MASSSLVPDPSSAEVQIRVGVDPAVDLPYIDVIDSGEGIDDALLPHIFEPFFTTEATGTGLGLYLSRELCQANQASLSYRPAEAAQPGGTHPEHTLDRHCAFHC